MKKSAKILSLILSLVMSVSVFSLAACGNETGPAPKPKPDDDPPAHTHTYATEWTKDATNHWHAATCEHTTEVKDKAAHDTAGTDGACSVCGYKATVEHEHTFATDAWKISDTKHWRAATCEHTTEKGSEAAHDTEGKDGACSVCGFKAHTHTYKFQNYSTKHYQEKTCDPTICPDDNPDAPKLINLEDHTINADGRSCSVCGMSGLYTYDSKTVTGCINCEKCGGCIRMQCPNAGNEDHKSCADKGADAKRYTLETEEGECSRPDGNFNLYDGRNDVRDCIHGDYCDVKWTVNVNKAATVALRIRAGRRDGGLIGNNVTIFVNDEEWTSNAILAAPTSEDGKCCMWWYDLGCIDLKEGENIIEIFQLDGGWMMHIDKIELVTAADVTVTHDPVDNTQHYRLASGVFVDMPQFKPKKN